MKWVAGSFGSNLERVASWCGSNIGRVGTWCDGSSYLQWVATWNAMGSNLVWEHIGMGSNLV